MKALPAEQLGTTLKTARAARGLSTRALAELAQVDQATIVRFESGFINSPRPDKLVRVAEALGLNPADVLTQAGVTTGNTLPALRPYLRTKYHDLTADDIAAIERFATRLAKKRGVSLDGPAPGEDEA